VNVLPTVSLAVPARHVAWTSDVYEHSPGAVVTYTGVPSSDVTAGWLITATSEPSKSMQSVVVDHTVDTATRGLPRTRTRNVLPLGTWRATEPWFTRAGDG